MRCPDWLRTPRGGVDWEYLCGVALFLAITGLFMLALMGCASVEEPDHWRDAVKNDKGLIRGS